MFSQLKKIAKKFSFKDFPILVKVSFCFIFVILFMIIISTTTFSLYKSDKYTSTLNIVKQMNSQTITEIDNYIQNITDLTKTPLFYKNSIQALSSSNTNPYEFLNVQKDLNSIIDNIFSLNKNIHSVFIFNLYGKSYYTVQGGDLKKNYSPINEAWFKQCVSNFGTPVNIPTFTLPNSFSNTFKSPYVFSTARALVSYDNSSVAGVILINSSVDVLANAASKLLIYPGQRIIIADKNGYVLYDTDGSDITAPLNVTLYDELVAPAYKNKNVIINGDSCLATKEISKLTDWQVINIIPNYSLNKSITEMSTRITLLTIFFIILACLLVLLITRQIVITLKRLSSVMKIVEKGNFDIKVPENNNDELGRLSKTFNTMTSKIKDLIDEVYVNKIRQNELELQMLQNQINPHFIYNTLESIHMMAEINNDGETSEMAVNFGKILRYGLSGKQKVVTVKEEIYNLNAYIMLLKNRYENIEDIIIDIDSTLYDKQIIKLIFQPIVENSVYHGLATLESGGKITVLGYLEGNNIIFEISDNGAGMSEEQVESLNGYVNDKNDNFKSIGLKNVNMRIKLYYGDSSGIYISSILTKGTTVKIVLSNI